jgi:hypothetical protein
LDSPEGLAEAVYSTSGREQTEQLTLIDLRLTGGQDGVRYAAKLISRFGYLANGVSNADFRPTNQHAEVQKLLAERVRDTVTRFDALVAKELAAFNDLLKTRNIQHIVAK